MTAAHPDDENGFTGLEAAIVLIAFVVVAAVFSYVALGAGFFTSQTAQSTIHTGVQQSSSSFELIGNVYGLQDDTWICDGPNNDCLAYINVTLGLTAGDTPIDISQMVVSYNDGQSQWPNLTYSGENCGGPLISQVWHTDAAPSTTTGSWCIAQKINNASTDTSEILNPNEQFILAIQMPYTTTPNTQFTVVLMPPEGAALTVTRTVPASITPVQILY
jgi:flagellin FlaB